MAPRQDQPYTQTTAVDAQFHGPDFGVEGNGEQADVGFPQRLSSVSSHGAVASHFQAYGNETWVDFLQESGADPVNNYRQPTIHSTATTNLRSPQPSSSSSSQHVLPNHSSSRVEPGSTDRKRRLTTAESPVRRPSNSRMHSSTTGMTSADPIVLDSSPAILSRMSAPLPPLPHQSHGHIGSGVETDRRQSDLVLPRWQPDSEVTLCPVCGRYFTFLFRKHHCRKCGRVVCSSCSPHRITIPRQFIVQPPSENAADIIDLTGDDETTMSTFGPFRNPALGGGEEVRVCNPCVPDPNYSPPPQYHPAASPRYPAQHAHTARFPYAPSPELLQRQHRSPQGLHDASQTVSHYPTQRPRDQPSTGNNRRVSYHGSSNSGERWLPPLPNGALQSSHSYQHGPTASRSITGPVHNHAQFASNFISGSPTNPNSFPRSIFTTFPLSSNFPPQQAPPPRPRRQIAEEDECPICGDELPPKDAEDDDSARTLHIEECIALHSASTSTPQSQPQTSTSLPNQRTRGMSSAADYSSAARGGEVGTPGSSSNANRMSHAARGMFPYIATEKDCVDDEGKEDECIICLEDFEAGDRMARLVCWCKFHEKCIKEWWDKKGRGACPTHQLQE